MQVLSCAGRMMEIPRTLRLVLVFWQGGIGIVVVRLLTRAAKPERLSGAVLPGAAWKASCSET